MSDGKLFLLRLRVSLWKLALAILNAAIRSIRWSLDSACRRLRAANADLAYAECGLSRRDAEAAEAQLRG